MLDFQTQPFFNTIQLTDAEWNEENEKAIALQDLISRVFEANPKTPITSYQMKKYLDKRYSKNYNLNSVRRCLSNLKKSEFLIKTKQMRMGDEGKPEHFYIIMWGNEWILEVELEGKTIAEYSKLFNN